MKSTINRDKEDEMPEKLKILRQLIPTVRKNKRRENPNSYNKFSKAAKWRMIYMITFAKKLKHLTNENEE